MPDLEALEIVRQFNDGTLDDCVAAAGAMVRTVIAAQEEAGYITNDHEARVARVEECMAQIVEHPGEPVVFFKVQRGGLYHFDAMLPDPTRPLRATMLNSSRAYSPTVAISSVAVPGKTQPRLAAVGIRFANSDSNPSTVQSEQFSGEDNIDRHLRQPLSTRKEIAVGCEAIGELFDRLHGARRRNRNGLFSALLEVGAFAVESEAGVPVTRQFSQELHATSQWILRERNKLQAIEFARNAIEGFGREVEAMRLSDEKYDSTKFNSTVLAVPESPLPPHFPRSFKLVLEDEEEMIYDVVKLHDPMLGNIREINRIGTVVALLSAQSV